MSRLCTVKVVREEDFRSQIGHDGHYFDLVDFSRVPGFQVVVDTPICHFKEQLAEEFGIPIQSQRLWLFVQRINGTFRPCTPLAPNEEKLSVLHPLPVRNMISKDDILVFLKLYDPGQRQLRYVSTLFVKASSRPSRILPKLRTLAGFHAYEEIELYEEVNFEPTLMCVRIDINATFTYSQIQNGDIICYQKMPKAEDKYPNVELFFKHVHGQKDPQIRIQALEEEVAMLKHQVHCEKEAKKGRSISQEHILVDMHLEEKLAATTYNIHLCNAECDELKQELDNAMRQVDELRDQNRHIILEFSIQDLEQATENFSDMCNVGDNEYGGVYKGNVHKTMVAIKLSCSQSLFQQEVSILQKCRHPNIVTIIGICSEASALVYEWLPNGNLEDCIVSSNNSPPPLPWCKRTQIIGDVCCTLLFLHANKPSALVHGDLRPCNILIDANYRSKLCNFGLSNLFLAPGAFPPNLNVRLPYIDPEFLTTGELTPQSDIYSLGVIILRVLTGMSPFSIAKKVASALESDTLHLMIDKSAGNWPYTQAKQLAFLGLSCMEMTREKRPDLLTDVWKVIEPMVTRPLVAYFQSVFEGSSAPAHFFCPIRMEIMKDPQVASDGFTYESEAIKHWLDRGNTRSPMTNLALPNRDIIPNHALRSCIQEYLEFQRQQGQNLDP
ncbi:hypothetical protein SORBI_3001G334400 [Sorghum bicolor]|uniref:RING-type E3 ubiquitin transferase n=1 Tax=Sorghum bicolor TaxID=4558 RepID=A0A1Z5S8W2_SORBI|nr:hypothetical protein SORBI_3001G334400 [Sorghum bicolor]